MAERLNGQMVKELMKGSTKSFIAQISRAAIEGAPITATILVCTDQVPKRIARHLAFNRSTGWAKSRAWTPDAWSSEILLL